MAIWGCPGRKTAWTCMCLSLLIGLVSLVMAVWDPRYYLGLVLLPSALWMWAAIRWLDNRRAW